MFDCLLSIPKDALPRHPEYPHMIGAPGTPYYWGDSDYSTQFVGIVGVGNGNVVERVYWVSPKCQANQVICDLNRHTGEKVYVQRSVPEEFRPQMREHVGAFFADLQYRSGFESSVPVPA